LKKLNINIKRKKTKLFLKIIIKIRRKLLKGIFLKLKYSQFLCRKMGGEDLWNLRKKKQGLSCPARGRAGRREGPEKKKQRFGGLISVCFWPLFSASSFFPPRPSSLPFSLSLPSSLTLSLSLSSLLSSSFLAALLVHF
jgi:hypothetical protein